MLTTQRLDPTVFKTTVISLMNGSNNSTKKNIARMFHKRGDPNDYIMAINELLIQSTRCGPRIVEILEAQEGIESPMY